MREDTKLRVARPSDRLAEVVRFYRDGLGFAVLGSFEDHDGFDGVMLGCPEHRYHLELTHKHGHTAGRAPTQDNLLVFYLPDRTDWTRAVERMRAHGYEPVPSFNPYWDRLGETFEDPDGYRVVLQNADWPVAGPPAAARMLCPSAGDARSASLPGRHERRPAIDDRLAPPETHPITARALVDWVLADDEAAKALLVKRPQSIVAALAESRDEGSAEGHIKEKRQGILRIFAARGIKVPRQVQARIAATTDGAMLDRWFAEAITVARPADMMRE